MLSAVSWTGAGGDFNWTNAQNWSTGVVPGSSSDVTISVTPGTIINGPTTPTLIDSITMVSGELRLSGGGPMTVSNGVTIDGGATLVTNGLGFTSSGTLSGAGTLDLSGSTVNVGPLNLGSGIPTIVMVGTTFNGSGAITVPSSYTQTVESTVFNVPVTNNGTLIAMSSFAATTFNGAFANSSGASFQVQLTSGGNGSNVVVTTGFTNHGTIAVNGTTTGGLGQLTITNGSLTNASGGTLTLAGALGSRATYNANVVNQGTLTVPSGLVYEVSTIHLLTNTGTISGTGTLNLTSCANVTLGAMTLSTSVPTVIFNGTSVIGTGALTIGVGYDQFVESSVFNVPVTVRGTLDVMSSFAETTFNGAFFNAAAANFNIDVTSGGNGSHVGIANGFTNSGTILLTAGTGATASLTVLSGTLTNAATINFGGTTNFPSTLDANVNNTGTINVPSGTTYRVSTSHSFTNTGALTGTGAMDLTSCSNLNFGALTLSATMPQFVINGTIFGGTGALTIGANFTQKVESSTFNCPVTNRGTLDTLSSFATTTYNGTFFNAAHAVFIIDINTNGNGSHVQITNGFNNQGTIQLTGGVSGQEADLIVVNGTLNNQATITFTGSTTPSTLDANLNNTATINVPSGETFDVSNSHTLTNTGMLTGTGTIDLSNCPNVNLGPLTVSSSIPKLILNGTTLGGTGTLTIASGFTQTTDGSIFNVPVTNQGTLIAESSFATTTFNGAFSNPSGGSFQIQLGSQGNPSNVVVTNGFTNSGTITVYGVPIVNNFGDLTVPNGNLTNASGGVITFGGAVNSRATLDANIVNQGTITVPAGETFRVSTTHLLTNQGTLSGSGTMDMTGSTVNLGAITISSSLPTMIFSGTTVNGTGALTIGTNFTQLVDSSTFNAPVTNRGTLQAASTTGGTVFHGAFFNANFASFQIVTDANGNASSVTVSNGFTNSGTIILNTGKNNTGGSLTLTTGTLTNGTTGVINASGVGGIADFLNANLNNTGTIIINSQLTYTGNFTNSGTIDVAAPQIPNLLADTIQAGNIYPSLGAVVWNGTGTAMHPQFMEALSQDDGATSSGFVNNSDFLSLTVNNNTYVTIVDQTRNHSGSTGSEAVYVQTLNVAAGSTLNLNGLHVYAHTINVQGTILNGTIIQD